MGRLNKVKWGLLGCLLTIIILIVGSVFVPGKLTNAIKWLASQDFAGKVRVVLKPEVEKNQLIEMVVEAIGISNIDAQPVVILKEKEGEVYLPIWIGFLEADAISIALEGIQVPRPLTADLLCSVLEKVGASVKRIVINDLRERTFYATITLDANWMEMAIDARPSDAIAVALRTQAPIYVEKAVLDKAGIPTKERDKYTLALSQSSY